MDSGHFAWEDAADQYAALVEAWWARRFKDIHDEINDHRRLFLDVDPASM